MDKEFIINTYNRQHVILEKGIGSTAIDINNKKYIDFSSGIGVNSLGFCNEDWTSAIIAQVQKIQHTSNLYYTIPQVELAQKLCSLTGFSKVFFSNSGAEANEGAIKIARKYSFDKYGENRYNILTLNNSFHGRTITTLKATGQDVFHNYFFPFTEGFEYTDANNINQTLDILKNSKNSFCAVMLEIVQGEGGVIPLDKDYLEAIYNYCEQNDILFIVDEVQTGIGRTGSILASEQFNIKPDIVTLAKGLGGGLPIGAVLCNLKTQDVLGFSDHGTTYGGNPVVCAGASVVLDSVSNSLEDINKKSVYILNKLEQIKNSTKEIKSISGLGLMLGIELETKNTQEVLKSCLDEGLIILSAKTKLRMLPPLNISYQEIDDGLGILENVLKK